jgi:hypothetical protein
VTYLRLAGLAAFLAVLALALWYRGQAISASNELDLARVNMKIALDANAAQEATIGRLRATAEANDRLLAEMATDLDAIRQGQAETSQAITDLKEASDDVRAFLGTPVPPDLERLLNK